MGSETAKASHAGSWISIALLLILIAGAASFLRLWNLGRASFWVDEINTVFAASSYVEKGTFELPSGVEHVRAPLHLYLTAFVFRHTSVNEFSTRLIPALFGIVNVLLVYLLASRFFNWKVGMFAAFLMAFSHFEIGWSRTARAYTLLQSATILFAYTVLMALESRKSERVQAVLKVKGDSLLKRLGMFWNRWGVSPLWAVPAVLIILGSYLYLHKLAIFWGASLFLYLFFMAAVMSVVQEGAQKIVNIYCIGAAGLLIAGTLPLLFLPQAREALHYFFTYTPPWAMGIATGEHRLNLVYFLMSQYRMPLMTLFFIGSVQAFFRYNARALFLFIMFTCQLFLLCCVFTHNTQVYIFNVYPFFLILAAYGFVNLVSFETLISRELLKKNLSMKSGFLKLFEKHLGTAVTVVLLLIFVLTPWLRISLHIPFNPDGFTNGAVTPAGWKEASAIIREQSLPGDLLISSLPATSIYYGTHPDYCLNWSLLEQAKEKQSSNDGGVLVDIYGGAPCITSLDDLKRIITDHPAGWIVLETYHWAHDAYVPEFIRTYLTSRFGAPISVALESMCLFRWTAEEEQR
ncbi:glycosyltransferase family 39 protein [bacterium]|nr:glycosyltransferase family 39 protein [bacterium]